MIGTHYWSTGITCSWMPGDADGGRWMASLDFLDDGFANDDPEAALISTEGRLHTRYYVRPAADRSGLAVALDVLISDAARLGIRFGTGAMPPVLYAEGDGEGDTVELPSDWRELLSSEAARIGWATYGLAAEGRR